MRDLRGAAEALRVAVTGAGRGLVERDTLIELVALAAVAREHLLVIGPPGTAKSAAVRRVATAVGGRYFEYLLGRFTEPSEIFGPVNLRKLRDGVVETEIEGMLPDAEVAFLDEVFLGSTAILNTLLMVLNERVFVRGHTRVACPLRVCVGAANRLPDDETLSAFADRFLLRLFVDAIGDPRLEELLAAGRLLERDEAPPRASLEDLDVLIATARDMELGGVRETLADAIRLLRGAGIELSDRRCVKVQNLIAAAAVIDGRTAATGADLWPLIYAVPTAQEQDLAREVLRDLLEAASSTALAAAATEASAGPLARAASIVRSGESLFAERNEGDDPTHWRLRLEGLAREIDAGFATGDLPPDLEALRRRIVNALSDGEPRRVEGSPLKGGE